MGEDAGQGVLITPDAVALDLDVATVGSRGIAYLLDLALFLAVALVLSVVQLAFADGTWLTSGLGVAVGLVLAFAWQFGYPIAMETLWRGRTLGKAALGLRVVTVEGSPVGLRHAAIRAATATFELLGTSGLVASAASFASRRGQRLGDLAAGTVVVRERRHAPPPQVLTFRAPIGAEEWVARADVSRIGAREYALLRDTLRRLPELREPARTVTADRLAAVLVPRVAPLPPPGVPSELALTAVAAAVQRGEPAPGRLEGDG
ncbi:MAG: RDD family protein [Nitriliruptoraceae bacterium]